MNNSNEEFYRITVGRTRFDKEWKVKAVSWEQLAERLRDFDETAETVAQYAAMSREDRTRIKDVGGFVGGPQEVEGARNNAVLKVRSLVTIDVDGDANHIPDIAKVTETLRGLGYTFVIHSTHSHTPERPRFRVVMPLDREVSADEYVPIALRIAERIGFDVVDPTTTQKARIMFWPSCSKDGEAYYDRCDMKPVDTGAMLSTYVDWRNAAEWPGTSAAVKNAQRRKHITGDLSGEKCEDPTAKSGVIGAFCSVYSVDDVIAEFGLPYKKAGNNRYTYTGGSSYGGAVVYGGGSFIYSNHASDPISMQLCNAFDLLRIHKFGDLDIGKGAEVPVNRLPSYAETVKLAENLPEVKKALVRQITKSFDNLPDTVEKVPQKGGEEAKDGGQTPCATRVVIQVPHAEKLLDSSGKTEKEDDSWMEELDSNKKNLLNTPNNFALIFSHDKVLRGHFMKDIFANRRLVTDALPWDEEDRTFPRELTDTDISSIILYFSQKWKIHGGKDALIAALDVAVSSRTTHPVREWLESLPEWDGVVRAERVFIDYLGAADTELMKAVTRKHLVAALRRVYRPGCKYDQVLVLAGPEGTGKSSIIEVLSNGWYMDSGIPVGDKEAYQNLVGHWLVEMGELADYEAKSTAVYKNFISSQVDRYRPPYGRETVSVPRQCVFFGTTNETGFLKGRTGNRRFWVVDCPGNPERRPDIFNGVLKSLLPQIWAEVKEIDRRGESLVLDGVDAIMMREIQAGHEGMLLDDNVNIVREFILMPKPCAWPSMSIAERRDWYRGKAVGSDVFGGGSPATFLHDFICVKEIALVVFGQMPSMKSRYEDDSLYYICDHMDCLKKMGKTMRFGKEIGVQKGYQVIRENRVFEWENQV